MFCYGNVNTNVPCMIIYPKEQNIPASFHNPARSGKANIH